MEINENICVCDKCKLPSDFGRQLGGEVSNIDAHIIYKFGEFYVFENKETFMCNTCIEEDTKFYNEWFWGETT